MNSQLESTNNSASSENMPMRPFYEDSENVKGSDDDNDIMHSVIYNDEWYKSFICSMGQSAQGSTVASTTDPKIKFCNVNVFLHKYLD